MSALANYESNERTLLDKLLSQYETIEDYWFTKGKICYDTIIVMKTGLKNIGECKVRNFKRNKYPDYILEKQKLISLINRCVKEKYHKILYINFFDSDNPYRKDFIIFDITARIPFWKEHPPVVKKMWMNEATYLSKTHKVEKEVILLQYNERYDVLGDIGLN